MMGAYHEACDKRPDERAQRPSHLFGRHVDIRDAFVLAEHRKMGEHVDGRDVAGKHADAVRDKGGVTGAKRDYNGEVR
jgi:hypothetical protein